MQPQPTASISAPPPPPPPPPPLSLAAFTQAASATSRYSPTLRKPTLQLAVVLGSATPRLLRHAHHTLCALAAKGIHGFLQTEIERSATAVCTPITSELLPDIVAASRADFLVLLSDRNLRTRTVQLRLLPNSDFIDVPLARLCDIVLDAWTQRLRTVTDVVHLQSLPANPNVITTAHLDALLHSISNLSALRRSYAKLARLANITQHWHSVRIPTPLPLSPPNRSRHLQHQKEQHTQLQPQHQQQSHNYNLPNASTSSLSNTSFVPSSVASPWHLSEQPSSTPSSALSATPKASLVNADHLASNEHDPSVPASYQPSGKPDTPVLNNRSAYSPQLRLVQQGFATSTEPQHTQQQSATTPSTNTIQSTPTASNPESTSILNSDQQHHPEHPSAQNSTDNPSTQSVTHAVPCETDRTDLSSDGDDHSKPNVHPLAAKALRRALKSVTRIQERKQRNRQASDLHSDFTFSWLKRSEHLSAKLMRHQFLACHLHRNLLEARDFISQMQVSSRPTRYYDSKNLPTEAHRQRLLREIHDLVPRIEELGKRLCKRPTAKHHRQIYHETNPWDAYIARAQYATIARGIQGSSERQREFDSSAWWRCWACRALNSSDASKCNACRTTACGTTQSSSLCADRLTERMREAIRNAQVAPPPWVFAPEVLPLPPPSVAHPLPNRWIHSERRGPVSLPPPFFGDDGLNDPPWGYNTFPQGANGPSERHIPAHDGFNLTAALNKLSCDDEHQMRENEISRRGTSAVNRGSEFRMSSPTRRIQQAPFPNRKSPPRLATSVPSGPSHSGILSRAPKNGMHSSTARKGMSFEQSSTGSSILQNLGLDTQTYRQRKQASVLTGSFPSIDPRGSQGLYGSRASVSSSTQDAYETVDTFGTQTGFRERNYPPRFKSGPAQPREELAVGSYEAKKSVQRLPNEIHAPNPARVPGQNDEYQSGDIALRALAAATDAANGGTGSATKESLRTVSAAITAAEDESQKPVAVSNAPNGMYNMF